MGNPLIIPLNNHKGRAPFFPLKCESSEELASEEATGKHNLEISTSLWGGGWHCSTARQPTKRVIFDTHQGMEIHIPLKGKRRKIIDSIKCALGKGSVSSLWWVWKSGWWRLSVHEQWIGIFSTKKHRAIRWGLILSTSQAVAKTLSFRVFGVDLLVFTDNFSKGVKEKWEVQLIGGPALPWGWKKIEFFF